MPLPYPRLHPLATLEPQPDGRFLLGLPPPGGQVRIGPNEARLLARLDGVTPPSELELQLRLLTGRPVQPGTLVRLAGRLASLGLVELPPARTPRWLPDDRTHCGASGECCHLEVGPLDLLDWERLAALPWEEVGESLPDGWLVVRAGGGVEATAGGPVDPDDPDADRFLLRQPDSRCVFLEPDGRCRVHRLFGGQAKPTICRVYPLFTVEADGELRVAASPQCPGACASGEGAPLDEEVARLGDLLLRPDFVVGPLAWCYPTHGGMAHPAGDREAAELAALEPELLAGLLDDGPCAEAALARALRRALAQGGDRLPDGGPVSALNASLVALIAGQAGHLSRSRDRQRVGRLLTLLQDADARDARLTELARPAATVALDRWYRRALRVQLFARHHLFRFGLLPGLALLARLQLLARLAGAEALAARSAGAAPLDELTAAPALQAASLLAPGLIEFSGLAGIGRRTLEQLAEALETVARLAGAPREVGPA